MQAFYGGQDVSAATGQDLHACCLHPPALLQYIMKCYTCIAPVCVSVWQTLLHAAVRSRACQLHAVPCVLLWHECNVQERCIRCMSSPRVSHVSLLIIALLVLQATRAFSLAETMALRHTWLHLTASALVSFKVSRCLSAH